MIGHIPVKQLLSGQYLVIIECILVLPLYNDGKDGKSHGRRFEVPGSGFDSGSFDGHDCWGCSSWAWVHCGFST